MSSESHNRDGLLCTHCLKVCPNDNLRLSARRPFADFFQPLGLTAAQVGFVLVVSGFVVYEVLSEWAPSKTVVKWAPNQVVAALGLAGPAAGLAGAVVMFVVFPAVIFLVVIVLARLLGRTPPAASAKALALMLLPTMDGAHLIKAAFKMTSRLPYWPMVMADTSGVETANRIAAGTLKVNKSLPQSLQPVTTALAAVVLVASLVVVLAMVRRQASLSRLPVRTRAAILAGGRSPTGQSSPSRLACGVSERLQRCMPCGRLGLACSVARGYSRPPQSALTWAISSVG